MTGKKDIAGYIEQVELYFAANYIKVDYEVAMLLALIGADVYGVQRNLLAPELPKVYQSRIADTFSV